MSRTVLLGLDGATFELLDPLVETGRVPVLAELLGSGARGTLASTVPPVTSPAWPTMFTGRNPGAHGMLSFQALEPGSLRGRAMTLRDVAGPRLWSVLDAAGVRTGLFNVPATYPAEPVEGFMVSGFIAPPGAPELVRPAALRGAFAAAFPAYDPNGAVRVRDFDRPARRAGLLADLGRLLEVRAAALDWMLEREPVDFLWVVLETLDRLSHYAYAFLAPGAPLYGAPGADDVRAAALDLLERHDRVLGRVLERMGPDPVVLVASDHGFAATGKWLDLCGWLTAEGFMVPAPRRTASDRLRDFGAKLARALGRKSARGASDAGAAGADADDEAHTFVRTWDGGRRKPWDWTRSPTWLGPVAEYGVRVNTTDLHPDAPVPPEDRDGLVERLVAALRAARDPEDGRLVFDRVDRRENLYTGPYVSRAPDVVFVPRRDVIHRKRGVRGASAAAGWLARPPAGRPESHHDSAGVFAACGGPFRRIGVEGVAIPDVAPTLLAAMGVAVPLEMEGRVVTEAFSPEYLAAHPVRTAEPASPAAEAEAANDANAAAYSAADEAAIARRLEELGYL